MTKKNTLFGRLKRFFGSGTKSILEKEERRKRWLFGKFKSRCLPAIPAPPLLRARSVREAEQEKSKHAEAVAVATAVGSEAAIAAVQASPQVVRLPGTSLSYDQSQEFAAIKIQTAFRGCLARRALQALKGLVKLQSLIRGQAVRRQTALALNGLQSLLKIQSLTCAIRVRAMEELQSSEGEEIVHRNTKGSRDVKTTLRHSSGRRWNDSILTKEEIIASLKNQREAAIKRERALEYASSYQERRNSQRPNTPTSKESELDVADERWSWLEQWVGTQPPEKDNPEILQKPYEDHNIKAEETHLGCLTRRSFNRPQRTSLKDEESLPTAPSCPSYMASTASTLARFRSLSTPKQRMGTADYCYNQSAPYTARIISPFPSIASDAGLSKTGKPSPAHNQQKSPRLEIQTGSVKSRGTLTNLSFGTECSLQNWDCDNTFR